MHVVKPQLGSPMMAFRYVMYF